MGFSRETFEFLADLGENNNRAWFEANRDRYEAHWKAAALDFIAKVSEDMADLDPPLRAEPRLNGSLRRINRDVRFSKDKSPYSPRLHLVFWSGDHPNRSPAMHFVLRPDGVGYGAGLWGIPPDALARYRSRIVSETDGDALLAALDAAAAVGCHMGKPDLVRLPRGFEAEGRRADLLRHKAFVVRTGDEPASKESMIGDGARRWARDTTMALMPVIRWLVN